jgi:mannosyltransferase
MNPTRHYTTNEVVIILIGLMSLVIMLSVFLFSHQSLRLDEAQSLWQTSHSPMKILNLVAQDVHVPFYHLTLHSWRYLVDDSVMSARILSLIFYVLSIPALYFLGKRTYGKGAGLLAAFLFSISAFMNWYGNEIRMYSIFTFLTLVNQYYFLTIYKEPRDNAWLIYGVTAVIGIYTHYFFWLVLLTEAIFFFMFRDRFEKNALRRFITLAIVLVLAFSPWITYVRFLNTVSNQSPILLAPTTINIFNTFSQFLFGFQSDHLNTILLSLWPLAVLLGFLAVRKSGKTTPETAFLLMNLIIPIVISFSISTLLRPVYVNRYLIFTLPALYLFLAWVFSTYPQRLSRALTAILIIAMLGSLAVEAASATTPVKENYREASEYLSENASSRDVIVVSAPFTVYPVEYYYKGPAAIETIPLWNRFITGPIPPFSEEQLPIDIETIKGDHYTLWLLLSYDQGYEEKVRLYFDTHFERIFMKNFSPGLNLYHYKLRYDASDTE